MSTLSQIEANRRNAAKSTGPRSVEGKASSRMNALQTGIHAESTIIIGEDSDDLTQLAQAFYQDHQPETAMECALLDNIIRDTWLLTRFSRIDAEIIDHEIEDDRYPIKINQAGKAFMDSGTDQIRLQRRIDATRKSQIQAFKELQRLQAERRAQPAPQPHPPAQPLDATAVSSMPKEQIGFVPPEPSQPPAGAPLALPLAGRPLPLPLAGAPLPLPPAAKTRLLAVGRLGFVA